MKLNGFSAGARRAARGVLLLCLCGLACAEARAQEAAAAAVAPEQNAAQTRLERARSLAVIGNFSGAAAELEALRSETKDEAAADVTRILLMNVYLKQSSYRRADDLLQEIFDARTGGGEKSTRLYFAVAGQLINGVRSRLERYREFGLNHNSLELAPEARADLDQMRSLLERVVEQARQIRNEVVESNARTRGADAVALLEDAAAVRLSMVRTSGDRTRWQREVAEARQHLVASETRLPETARRAAAPAPAANAGTAPSSAPADEDASSRSLTLARPAATPAPSAPASRPPAQQNPAQGAPPQSSSAPAVAAGSPVSLGSLVDRATEKVQPAYPPVARNMRVTGVVTVFVLVNEKGQVESVQRASGPALLQQAASDAARRWKFRPMLVDGQPVRVSGYINFNFSL